MEEIDIKVLDKPIQEEMKERLKRKTGEELNIKDLRKLKISKCYKSPLKCFISWNSWYN